MANTVGGRHIVVIPPLAGTLIPGVRYINQITVACTGLVAAGGTYTLEEDGVTWLTLEMDDNQTHTIRFAKPQRVKNLKLAVRDDTDCRAYIYFD